LFHWHAGEYPALNDGDTLDGIDFGPTAAPGQELVFELSLNVDSDGETGCARTVVKTLERAG